MSEVPYGRFSAIEDALGGRAAVVAAYQQGKTLVGGGAALGALRPAVTRATNTWSDQFPHLPQNTDLSNLVLAQCTLLVTSASQNAFVTADLYESDGQGGWINDTQVARADADGLPFPVDQPQNITIRTPVTFIVPLGWGYILRLGGGGSLLSVTEQPLG